MEKIEVISGVKDLSLMDINIKTMSSLEIADLVESRHDNVKRTIERLAEKKVIQLPPMEEVKNNKGQTVSCYMIGKRDSYVVVAQLSPEFTARLVDRWQELEGNPLRGLLEKIVAVEKIIKLNGSEWGKAGVQQKKNKKIIKKYESLIVTALHNELDLFLEV